MTTKQSTKIPTSKATNAHALLTSVRRLILEEPKRYNQRTTLIVKGLDASFNDGFRFPRCGTIGCVAGWIISLKPNQSNAGETVTTRARHILGLTDVQHLELFNGGAADGRPQTKDHAIAGAKHIAKFQRKYRVQLLAKKV